MVKIIWHKILDLGSIKWAQLNFDPKSANASSKSKKEFDGRCGRFKYFARKTAATRIPIKFASKYSASFCAYGRGRLPHSWSIKRFTTWAQNLSDQKWTNKWVFELFFACKCVATRGSNCKTYFCSSLLTNTLTTYRLGHITIWMPRWWFYGKAPTYISPLNL